MKKLKYTKVSTILDLIENNDKNCELLFNDLKKDQSLRLPEVITQPWTVLYSSVPNAISQLVIPRDLNRSNRSKIISVIEMLKKKQGFRTAEEMEVISVLQSFVAIGSVPVMATSRRDKDDKEDKEDEGKEGERRTERRHKDEKKEDSRRNKDDKQKEKKDSSRRSSSTKGNLRLLSEN